MSESTIQLEAYSIPIRKQKIFCVGDLYNLDKSYNYLLHLYSEEVLRRNKIVVIFSDTFLKHQPKYLKNIYIDAIFRIRETQDLRLAYTYIQNCSKPLIVLWYGYDIPAAIFQSKDDITLIAGGTFPRNDFNSIFWSTKASYDEVSVILGSKMKDIDTKTILNETKASDVSLVWSSIGESEKRGSLYWFDFNSIKSSQPSINYAQASEYLRTLADALESREN
jgi:hypothetical protein